MELLALPAFTVCILIAVLGIYAYWRCYTYPRNPLPPGPRPLPMIGNILDLPPKGVPEFKHWEKHRHLYGPVSSVTIMGQTLILLHDRQAAHELLGRQSLKTAGRPKTEFGTAMCGYGELLPIQQYNDEFRLARKFMQQQMGTKTAIRQFDRLQENAVQRFLLRVLRAPQDVFKEIDVLLAATVLQMTYGYTLEPKQPDPVVSLAKQMLSNMDRSLVPGAWLVDIIPFLKYLPAWLPGLTFKKIAREWRELKEETLNIPYAFVRRQMAQGTHHSSYVSRLVQEHDDGGIHEKAIKSSAAVMFLGASDTTASALSSFVNAMILFPNIQSIAQAEIDQVVGRDRLPQIDDRDNLPYIDALVKEVHRWSPVAPMGLPHAAEEDIIWHGYFIPKGSYLFPAIWSFCHDSTVYEKPDAFDPARFLEPRHELDPKTVVFGYGRRSCPGKHFADSSLFLVIAQMLAVLEIRCLGGSQSCEGNGSDIEVGPGVINPNRLLDCKYSIKSRNVKLEKILQQTETATARRVSDALQMQRETMQDLGIHV